VRARVRDLTYTVCCCSFSGTLPTVKCSRAYVRHSHARQQELLALSTLTYFDVSQNFLTGVAYFTSSDPDTCYIVDDDDAGGQLDTNCFSFGSCNWDPRMEVCNSTWCVRVRDATFTVDSKHSYQMHKSCSTCLTQPCEYIVCSLCVVRSRHTHSLSLVSVDV
jgi:hypothetical protein